MISTESGTAKPLTATDIRKDEGDVVNRKGRGTDRNIKTADIGHETFSVGIMHRGPTVGGVAAASARGPSLQRCTAAEPC